MKKVLKVIGIIILVLVIFLFAAPFLFKGTLEKEVKKAINKNVNATVEWSDLSLSFFSSFPDARLKLEDVSVINKAPFAGDTLIYAKTLFLDMGIPQLLKSGPIAVNSLGLDQALVNVKVNKDGEANYDIAKESEGGEPDEEEESSGVSLAVKHYEIKDSRLNYLDEKSKMFLHIRKLNHSGSGDFSAETSTLHTQTSALVSFAMDTVNYLMDNSLKLRADIKMDLKNMKFTFEKNKLLINQLPLKFDGYVKVNDDNEQLDISFKTPSSDFKNFLGLIPEAYSKSLKGVETSGDFSVEGKLYGVIDDEHIPKMKITMASSNASFKYPDLPKAVKQINIDAVLTDETGLMKDLNLDLNRLSFKIDQDVFQAQGKFRDLTGNTHISMTANGILNLANIDKAYPVDLDMNLDGILKADLSTSFNMKAIENEQYAKVKSRGSASLSDFSYTSKEMANPVKIITAKLHFTPQKVSLEQFDMTTGQTDAHLTGKLENLMGFLFQNQPIKGNFMLTSHSFDVNDFMVSQADAETENKKEDEADKEQEASTDKTDEALKIPSFLDLVLNFKADKVLYDNLTLKNAKGALSIHDQKAALKNITADIFGGTIGLDGSVSTKSKTPTFAMDLSLQKIGIVQSFQEMDMLKKFAPIAKALVGDLTTTINLTGNLTPELTPIYNSLSGTGLAEILNAKVEQGKLPLISNLNEKLDFIKLNDLNLKDITAHFSFKDGGINIKPYHFKINHDIKTTINGRHTFDNQMDYTLNFDLPAKYLGKDVSSTLAQLSSQELADTKVDLPVELTGSLTHPKIKVDLKSAVEKLSKKIIAEQTEKAKDKVSEKAGELLNGLLGGDKKGGKDKKKAKKDSSENGVKKAGQEAAKDLLEGLFGKKKKGKEKSKKDGS